MGEWRIKRAKDRARVCPKIQQIYTPPKKETPTNPHPMMSDATPSLNGLPLIVTFTTHTPNKAAK